MSEKRVGGHVLRGNHWVPADMVEAEAEAPEDEDEVTVPSKSNTKAELLAAADAAGVEADESMTKAQILEALDG